MSYRLNPITGLLDLVNDKLSGGGGTTIPQYSTDPTSPLAEDTWVLRQGTGSGIIQLTTEGVPMGLLMALTYATTTTSTGIAFTYQLSYRTKENTTIRATLS